MMLLELTKFAEGVGSPSANLVSSSNIIVGVGQGAVGAGMYMPRCSVVVCMYAHV